MPKIPEKILPKINLHLLDTKPLYKGGLELEEINIEREKVNMKKRKSDWYDIGLGTLNYVGYVCIIITIIYISNKIGLLSALAVCFKGLFFNIWNSLCCKPCQINNFNYNKVNIPERNISIPLQSPEEINIIRNQNTLSVIPVKTAKNRALK